MRIYTKNGDTGLTGIVGAKNISKNHERINAYGTVDELNAIIAGILLHLPENETNIANEINRIQNDLFDIGSCLSRIDQNNVSMPLDQRVSQIEDAIDHMAKPLPPLKGFIIPSGPAGVVFSHMARTVCRRAERLVVGFIENLEPELHSDNYHIVLKYLNRLSDYFFTLARYINYRCHVVEIFSEIKCLGKQAEDN
jgi:cob(I)alamin adenosyltransferase